MMFSHTIRRKFSWSCIRKLHHASVSSQNAATEKLACPLVAASVWNTHLTAQKKQNDIDSLNQRLYALNLGRSCAPKLTLKPGIVREYRLPTLTGISVYKHTILDPRVNIALQLPEREKSLIEKLTPGLINIVPVKDPTPNGLPLLEKHAMPYLMRIRHKKMKKHKLKRLRKRMIFLNRKLTLIKNKKKEALLRGVEAKFAKCGQDFDPMKFVESELAQARRGGYKIDIFQSR